jgi:adenylosuccinate synthase
MGYGVAVINTIYIENYATPYARKVKTPALLVVDLEDKGTLKTDIIRLEKYISQHSVIWGNPNDEHFLISKISRVDQNLVHITELSMSEIRSALGWSKEVVIENE